jgi:hypothetical protein
MESVVVPASPTSGVFGGDLETANANVFACSAGTWSQTGTLIFVRISSVFKNGPARCRLREPFENIQKIGLTPTTGETMEIN